MYVFTPKICHVLLTTKHASVDALIHRQQTIHRIFTQTKLSSNYRHKHIVTYWALKKRQALLADLGETQLAIIFFYF